MADVNKERFDQRLRALEQKHHPKQRVEKRISEDGLVVEVAKQDRRRLIPYKSIGLAIVVFVLLKSFLFAELGEPEYLNRIASLQQGQAVEVAAAFLLDADPATRAIGGFLARTLP